MEVADLVVVTGSQVNVRQAYKSGKPALGVGLGNAPVIIDASADLDDAARKIMASKTFDHATSCSSENAVVIVDAGLRHRPSPRSSAKAAIMASRSGAPAHRRAVVAGRQAQPRRHRAGTAGADRGLRAAARSRKGCKFVMVDRDRHRQGLSALRREAVAGADRLSRQGLRGRQAHRARHPGLSGQGPLLRHPHQGRWRTPRELAETSTWCACWSIRRTPSATAAASTTDCPSRCRWAAAPGRATRISENLNWRCFVNITHLVTTIPEDKPSEEALFGAYWAKYGK